MTMFPSIILIWVFSVSVHGSINSYCPHHHVQRHHREFEQKTNRFWEFQEHSNSWVEVQLPYDLVSCRNGSCTKVGRINRLKEKREEKLEKEYDAFDQKENFDKVEGTEVLPLRKRISLTKVSDISIWITGESGSIYERFWNEVQWVISPHDLPISAGPAVSIFSVKHSILALSEAGILYQMQLSEISQPVWVELKPTTDQITDKEVNQNYMIQALSSVVSPDGMGVYFNTKNGTLLELTEIEPPRWTNHGRPPDADVAAIAGVATIRTEIVYTISSVGDLYEYDRSSKPLWKKHVWKEKAAKDHLMALPGCTLQSLNGDHSMSLFLLTKDGKLVERNLYKRKWKWIVHGRPNDHHLASVQPALHDESNEKLFSLFFTTSSGSVFEYRMHSNSGHTQKDQRPGAWIDHMHPLNAKASRGTAGLQFQIGRLLFALDDGRLAELHLVGLGGEHSGPTHTHHTTSRRKTTSKYTWSILDAPETEGWNAEYCTELRGPTNCITGTKDDIIDQGTRRSATRRPKGSQSQQNYLIPGASESIFKKSSDYDNLAADLINNSFRLRVMHGGRSFFLITVDGETFEYLYTEDVWLWLRHESSTHIKGAVGNYNGSLYLVDTYGSLLIRERSSHELSWINCTAFRKGKSIIGGPPWDKFSGLSMKITAEDALFFVSKRGRLLQFTVALRKFKWKDCRNPPNAKVASIIDQEIFRENVVFVIGTNGRLYQYNKVTEVWHEHHQSQHLLLSRLPGTATRPSPYALTGSLFMISEDGGLIEYHWNTWDGWNWVEHGRPYKGVTLVSAPGPCFEGNQLFLIGSDGKVYLRYIDQDTWKWRHCGFPYLFDKDGKKVDTKDGREPICVDEDLAMEKGPENLNDLDKNCDPKVASTRPIQFSEDAVIFELRDGRLAEMKQLDNTNWIWSRIIGTPTSLCIANYWTALAS